MNYKTIAQETLQIETQILLHAATLIDDVFDKAVDVILNCKGKLIVTGVGTKKYLISIAIYTSTCNWNHGLFKKSFF